MTEDPQATIRSTERWLDGHGLPWFVEQQQSAVRRRLSRAHLARVGALALVAAVVVGVAVGWWRGSASLGLAWGETTFGVLVGLWALRSLYGAAVVGWAARRTLRSLGLLFPLATAIIPLSIFISRDLQLSNTWWGVALYWLAAGLYAVQALDLLRRPRPPLTPRPARAT